MTTRYPLYREIAMALAAHDVCSALTATAEQVACIPRWEAYIRRAEHELPRGSGFDIYPAVDLDASNPNKIIIKGSYHKINDVGMYDGYADYRITVRPDLVHGFTLGVSGVGAGEFLDFLTEAFGSALRAEHPHGAFHTRTPVLKVVVGASTVPAGAQAHV